MTTTKSRKRTRPFFCLSLAQLLEQADVIVVLDSAGKPVVCAMG